ncbi:hypothetical protein [Pseudomonas sp. GL-RE-20]|uniref:hypothetical protein n=1 Tax=Pseudomonas sp. GL-RE-20 TaxID=2832372 RepID=UPI001CBC8B57|nr:hypothetical protein [Pseudomonas sp. GL-RE-20]
MNIKQHVSDARFLIESGRFLGALTVLTVAVAGSSKKVFPRGTKSRENPQKIMSDGEAFKLFLGARIRRILNNVHKDPEFGESGFSVVWPTETKTIESILYHHYRCELVHEAKLPQGIEFVKERADASSFSNNGVSVGLRAFEKGIVLDYGWLDVLEKAVVEAPCNGEEFGIKHYKLVANVGVDEVKFVSEIIAKYNASQARVNTFKNSVRLLSHDSILSSNDNELIGLFLARVRAGEISGVARLASRGLADTEGRLQPSGLAMLRDIAGAYSLVEY